MSSTIIQKLRAKWNKRQYEESAASLEKYNQMENAAFLSDLSDDNLKKFFMAQSIEGKEVLKRLDFIAKEIKKRGLK